MVVLTWRQDEGKQWLLPGRREATTGERRRPPVDAPVKKVWLTFIRRTTITRKRPIVRILMIKRNDSAEDVDSTTAPAVKAAAATTAKPISTTKVLLLLKVVLVLLRLLDDEDS